MRIPMEREIEELEMEQRYGLLDCHLERHHKTRQEEIRFKQAMGQLMRKLKTIAMSFLAFSMFIIVNDCIGLSSSPFYLPHIKCKPMPEDLTTQCLKLKHLSYGLYFSEMSGGFLLALQASLIYYFIDNYLNRKQMSCIRNMIRTLVIIYALIIIVRVALFMLIITHSTSIDREGSDKHFGVFLANFMENREIAIMLTVFIIGCIFTCFGLSFYTMRLLTEVDAITSGRKPGGKAKIVPWTGSNDLSQRSMILNSNNKAYLVDSPQKIRRVDLEA